MITNYTDQDIERGWINCSCGLQKPLEAGFDFHKEAWITCVYCGAESVDLESVKEHEGE